MSAPVVAEIVRSGFVEGHHYGSIVALGPSGDVEWAVGEVHEPILPRSCNKPIQALAMVRHSSIPRIEAEARSSTTTSGSRCATSRR